ncbi:oxidoreductase [Campylobacter sputorum subsp. bubulus]|uniref:Oxidoreductase n=1 Tax=Campylobacter sputorum subsp. sputorum TaxID=32024 RepID=A0A381DJJ2_9BACT|nr:hypothetical protein [Campylobacter sputorum]ASM35856.1 hypothetical protein CSPUT_1698 [Campylobacter sputorum aubsp. sputorum RM3237]ASM39207.1 hypothetical protein CSPARA_1680 [Campylobacter sputorum bv. paraureolyticus LMG 11764]MDY6121440.1 hypothetical protein [Campylobacter sputorum]QEL06046.1 hypothetical protein CSPT_1693 [Campylobacter sputorum subsp. sputorum]SUX09158.1 oxidoreductase [Campylobacter sputorum subsp. bubulus]
MENPYIKVEEKIETKQETTTDAKHKFANTDTKEFKSFEEAYQAGMQYAAQNPNTQSFNQNSSFLSSILPTNFNSTNFLQGAIVGALGTYLLTNENAQQAIFKSVVRVGKLLQAGSEEIKERFEDAKAEIEAENEL